MNRATAIAIVVALASGIAASVVTLHYTKIDSALPPGNGDAGERLSFECNGNQESQGATGTHGDAGCARRAQPRAPDVRAGSLLDRQSVGQIRKLDTGEVGSAYAKMTASKRRGGVTVKQVESTLKSFRGSCRSPLNTSRQVANRSFRR
jgi:hypothetical protein